jgi:hypothetical protein
MATSKASEGRGEAKNAEAPSAASSGTVAPAIATMLQLLPRPLPHPVTPRPHTPRRLPCCLHRHRHPRQALHQRQRCRLDRHSTPPPLGVSKLRSCKGRQLWSRRLGIRPSTSLMPCTPACGTPPGRFSSMATWTSSAAYDHSSLKSHHTTNPTRAHCKYSVAHRFFGFLCISGGSQRGASTSSISGLYARHGGVLFLRVRGARAWGYYRNFRWRGRTLPARRSCRWLGVLAAPAGGRSERATAGAVSACGAVYSRVGAVRLGRPPRWERVVMQGRLRGRS